MHLAYNDNKQLIVQGLYYTYLSSSEIGNCLNLDQLKSTRSNYIGVIQWRCSRGGGGGQTAPLKVFTGKFKNSPGKMKGEERRKKREGRKGKEWRGGGVYHM